MRTILFRKYIPNGVLIISLVNLIFCFSDAIRLILIYRYGGWYSDLDMVFLRPLNSTYNGESLANVAASDSVHFSNYEKSSEIKIGDKTIIRHDGLLSDLK